MFKLNNYYKELSKNIRNNNIIKEYSFKTKGLDSIEGIDDYLLTSLKSKNKGLITLTIKDIWIMYYEAIIKKVKKKNPKRYNKLKRVSMINKKFDKFIKNRKTYRFSSQTIFSSYLMILINMTVDNSLNILKKKSSYQDIINIYPYKVFCDQIVTDDKDFLESVRIIQEKWLNSVI